MYLTAFIMFWYYYYDEHFSLLKLYFNWQGILHIAAHFSTINCHHYSKSITQHTTGQHLKPKADLYSADKCRIPNNPSSNSSTVLKCGTHLTQLLCLEHMQKSQPLWVLWGWQLSNQRRPAPTFWKNLTCSIKCAPFVDWAQSQY